MKITSIVPPILALGHRGHNGTLEEYASRRINKLSASEGSSRAPCVNVQLSTARITDWGFHRHSGVGVGGVFSAGRQPACGRVWRREGWASQPGFHGILPVLKHRAAPSGGGKGCWGAREREKRGANKRGKRHKCTTKNNGGGRGNHVHASRCLLPTLYTQVQLTKEGNETERRGSYLRQTL